MNVHIKDFCDMKKFETIMYNWAEATGLATVAVDAEGSYISQCYNFTDFCIKLTRGCAEGKRRCEQCDKTGHGVYHCHAGLIDFSIDLVVNGIKVGAVIGGQVLPDNPDEEKFKKVAREIGVDPEKYVQALQKVNVRTESAIHASAELLGEVLNNFINAEYASKYNSELIIRLSEGVENCKKIVTQIQEKSSQLDGVTKRQNILGLNATIEAARAGDAGKGFTVVAQEVGKLSVVSKQLNEFIIKNVNEMAYMIENLIQ